MVLSSVPALLDSSRLNGGPNAINNVQCLVSEMAIYPLPGNIRMESLDFENWILLHVKSNFSNGNIDEVTCDLNRNLMNDTSAESPANVVEEENGEETKELKVTMESKECRRFVACLETNRLVWATLKASSPGEPSGKFDFTRHCCYMQTSFNEIKLCYVNIQLPNIIIWLLSSIPQKIVKKEVLAARNNGHHLNASPSKSLFALVWQCFREIDVANLRQAYKHLRSPKKARGMEPSLLAGKLTASRECDNGQKKSLNGREMNLPPNAATSKSTQHILSRQRQPARLIHENTYFHSPQASPPQRQATLERKTGTLSQKGFSSQFRSFGNSSESEFDTTQIGNYLSHSGKSALKGASCKARTRSRSVESPRHRFRLLYKPIADDIEILIPAKNAPSRKNAIRSLNEKEGNKSKDFSDSLNSEGSSLSDESTSGEFVPSSIEYEYFNLGKLNGGELPLPKRATPIVIKSVLKKSSSYFEGQSENGCVPSRGFFSSSFTTASRDRSKSSSGSRKCSGNSRQCANYSKKNVTFSAYATIQVVDN